MFSVFLFRMSQYVNDIQVVIAQGLHLFPFRSEKLSPAAPMVLRKSGRVGRRRSLERNSRFSNESAVLCYINKAQRNYVLRQKTHPIFMSKNCFVCIQRRWYCVNVWSRHCRDSAALQSGRRRSLSKVKDISFNWCPFFMRQILLLNQTSVNPISSVNTFCLIKNAADFYVKKWVVCMQR
jgi:hypothetical protein